MGNKTRKCSIKDLPREVVSEMSRFMSPSDKVLVCYETQTSSDWGRYKSYYAQVITQDRYIVYEHTHSDIAGDHSQLKGERLAELRDEWAIESGGDDWYQVRHSYFVTKQAAREFSDILRQAIGQAKAMPQHSNLLNELEKLTALHRSGALTDTEFQNAKRKLGI